MRSRALLPLLLLIGAACNRPVVETEERTQRSEPVVGVRPGVAVETDLDRIDREQLLERIRRYYGSASDVPDDVAMEVVDLAPSEIPGLARGSLRLSRGSQVQEVAFLLSGDGRWLLQTDPVDLTVDPVAQVLETISIGPDDPALGPDDARVTIVEYSDFQCPFCARADKIVQEEVLKAYGDRVRLVYKQFPLVEIHPWALPASAIGLCVFEEAGNEAYWKYHSAVFARQREIPNESFEETLLAIATDSGAEGAAVRSCVDAGHVDGKLEQTLAEAASLGVDSTPTFFINGRRLSGAQPPNAFQAIIDPVLGEPPA